MIIEEHHGDITSSLINILNLLLLSFVLQNVKYFDLEICGWNLTFFLSILAKLA